MPTPEVTRPKLTADERHGLVRALMIAIETAPQDPFIGTWRSLLDRLSDG